MQTLLPALQDILKTLTQINRQRDCYITPHVNWMPTGTQFPCLGIKDNGVARSDLTTETTEMTLGAILVAFTKLSRDGGDTVVSLFNLLDAAVAAIQNNGLATIAGLYQIRIGSDQPIEAYQDDNKEWLVKLARPLYFDVERETQA